MLKFVVVLLLATLALANALSDAEVAEKILNNTLPHFAAGEGPVYKLATVNSVTKESTPHSLYKVNADLIDADNKTKTCGIEILVKDGKTEVTFKCPGEEPVTRTKVSSLPSRGKKH